jgi:RimJ/RimL family protein N-acetyltransferase
VHPENVASARVRRNAGFQQEGRLRNFLSIDGSTSDALLFSVIPRAL